MEPTKTDNRNLKHPITSYQTESTVRNLSTKQPKQLNGEKKKSTNHLMDKFQFYPNASEKKKCFPICTLS